MMSEALVQYHSMQGQYNKMDELADRISSTLEGVAKLNIPPLIGGEGRRYTSR